MRRFPPYMWKPWKLLLDIFLHLTVTTMQGGFLYTSVMVVIPATTTFSGLDVQGGSS